MARRELLMLAKVYDATRHRVGGWYLSEKLDGTRCFWDGGISRGIHTSKIPWAGILDPKSGQPKRNIKQEATGLWSRYGNPIVAPDWFLNLLPSCPLDGELWAGRGNYQLCRSIVGKHTPEGEGEEWQAISFGVFSTPALKLVMADGEIRNANQTTDIRYDAFKRWSQTLNPAQYADWKNLETDGSTKFCVELANLSEWVDASSDAVFLIHQTKLPHDNDQAAIMVSDKLREILLAGGEGLMLRHPDSVWTPKRIDKVLKVKAALDDEAVVTGFTSGRKTNKGSKLLGMIGALILDYKGQRLELSGMTDEERTFATQDMSQYAADFPGQDMPANFQGEYFHVGDKVTFAYRELTDDGLPKEARLLRVRNEV